MAKPTKNPPKKSMTKAKAAKPKTARTKNSARKSKPKKPKKKPSDTLSGEEKAIAAKAAHTITGTTDRGIIALTEQLTQPGSGFAQMRRVDLVA